MIFLEVILAFFMAMGFMQAGRELERGTNVWIPWALVGIICGFFLPIVSKL